MGVYFASYLVYGLRIPEDYYDEPWDIEDDPRIKHKPIQFITGGDMLDGKNIGMVLFHPDHSVTTLDTAGAQHYPETFGVFPVEHMFDVSKKQQDDLLDLACELKVPHDIGYFVVTNVG